MIKHKKMYKAGKRWVVATLAVASIAVAGATVNSRVAHADTVSGTETQQVSNDGNSNATIAGTATQQAGNTASDDNTDPRITVVSGDQNQAQREQLQQQAQNLQQQIANNTSSINNLQDKVNQLQATAKEQAIKEDQAQIDQGNQLMNQAKQKKIDRVNDLNSQLTTLNKEHAVQLKKCDDLKQERAKLVSEHQPLQEEYTTLNNKYIALSKEATTLLNEYMKLPLGDPSTSEYCRKWKEAQKAANEASAAASEAFHKADKILGEILQIGNEMKEALNLGDKIENEQIPIVKVLVPLQQDARPYLPEDEDSYNHGKNLVDTYTKKLADDQAKQISTGRIRGLQDNISRITDQLNQAKSNLKQVNAQIAALPAVFQVKKTITRIVYFNLPDGQQTHYSQVATITGTKTVAGTGQATYSNWSTAEWPAFTSPDVYGDEYITPTAPARTVDSTSADQTITLSYTVAKDFAKENYGKLTSVIITPSNGSTMARLGLEGWHVADASRVLNHAYIIVKNQRTGEIVAEISYTPSASKEAQQAYPKIANSNQANFSIVLNIPLKDLNDPLEVIARYTNGDSYDTGSLNADYSFAPIKADMGNHAWLDQCTFVNGKLHVAGWHATNQAPGATHTLILFDASRNREISRITTEDVVRGDIQAIYPTIYNAGYSGFSADFNVTPDMVGDQLQIVSRWSGNDTNTNYVDYWFPAKLMMSGKDNNANLDQAKVINNHFTVAGWHATNQAAGYQYHTIILFDASQNRELTRISVTPDERADVARAFPQTFNAGESGFNVSFDLLPEMATDNIQVISRWSKSQDANTDYVDYWFAPQRLLTDDNKAALDGVSFANNQLQVAGWHATNQAVGRPYHTIIIFDTSQHRELGRKTVSLTERNDVARAFPQIITAGKSGFNVSFDLQPEMATDNIQIISRWSKSQDANTDYVDYWFAPQRLLTDQSNRAALDDVTSTNGQLVVTGWHATNLALGKKYHYIIVIDPATGKEIARQLVNSGMARPDVRKAFPGVANADQSGFKVAFTPNAAFAQARQLTIISRWTDDQGGNGNYVDYWFAPVTKPVVQDNVGKLESERYAWDTLGVTGWHATDQSLTEPYRTLILIDNTLHKEVARQSITSVARPDIAKKYPDIAGAGNSGFDTHFKVNGADPTHDFTLISRYSATRDANENCTDYDFHLGQLW